MGIEFGALTTYKEKGTEVSCIINGNKPYDDVKIVLDKFIDMYILCTKCKYPEMVLRVKKGDVGGKCDACGERS